MLSLLYNIFRCISVFFFSNAILSVVGDDNDNVEVCSRTKSSWNLREGILGEVVEFPWLGVLRMPIKEQDKPFRIVATGAVLVTVKFVIVNADDVYHTSSERLTHDGTIHFIATANKSWSCKLKSLIIHPEYDFATINTVALIELNLEQDDDDDEKNNYNPFIKPVCWPGIALNSSNALYVTGYTDERMLLEKVLYEVQYVTKDICDQFYKRSYLQGDAMEEPKSYFCVYAQKNKNNCKWDNGMVLVSNVTGHWTIVGFGVAGPGCSAPARFIDFTRYIDWIKMATADPLVYDYYGGDKAYKDVSY